MAVEEEKGRPGAAVADAKLHRARADPIKLEAVEHLAARTRSGPCVHLPAGVLARLGLGVVGERDGLPPPCSERYFPQESREDRKGPTRMTWYTFVLFVHVSMAIGWLGGALMMQFFASAPSPRGQSAR
jgi:hypothetical protein